MEGGHGNRRGSHRRPRRLPEAEEHASLRVQCLSSRRLRWWALANPGSKVANLAVAGRRMRGMSDSLYRRRHTAMTRQIEDSHGFDQTCTRRSDPGGTGIVLLNGTPPRSAGRTSSGSLSTRDSPGAREAFSAAL